MGLKPGNPNQECFSLPHPFWYPSDSGSLLVQKVHVNSLTTNVKGLAGLEPFGIMLQASPRHCWQPENHGEKKSNMGLVCQECSVLFPRSRAAASPSFVPAVHCPGHATADGDICEGKGWHRALGSTWNTELRSCPGDPDKDSRNSHGHSHCPWQPSCTPLLESSPPSPAPPCFAHPCTELSLWEQIALDSRDREGSRRGQGREQSSVRG